MPNLLDDEIRAQSHAEATARDARHAAYLARRRAEEIEALGHAAGALDLAAYVAAQARYYRLQGAPAAALVAEAIDRLAAGIRACETPGETLTADQYRDRIATLDDIAREQDETDRHNWEACGYARALGARRPTAAAARAGDAERAVEF